MAPSKLTPIKIRGKGPRKKAWQPPPPKSSKIDTKKRSRCSAEENDDTADSSSLRRKRRKEKLALKKAAGAPIEQLPKEILEMILLWSQNVYFPKASHRIGCVLSGESTLMRVVLSAFEPTWDVWFGALPREVQGYHEWRRDSVRLGGDPKFQSEVLACSWMSVDLMVNTQRFWFRRDARARRRREERALHYRPLEVAFPAADGFDATEEDIQRCFDQEWNGHLQWADEILAAGGRSVPDQSGDLQPELLRWLDSPKFMDMHPHTSIPDHLIRDPLRNPEKNIRLLYWLVQRGADIQNGQSWELAKLGYERIMEHIDNKLSLIALALFRCLGIFLLLPNHVKLDKHQEATDMMRITEYERRARWTFAEGIYDSYSRDVVAV